mgnify:CR=1 FL=1
MARKVGRPLRAEPYRYLGVEIPESLAVRLDAYIATTGTSKAFVYRAALAAYLAQHEKAAP